MYTFMYHGHFIHAFLNMKRNSFKTRLARLDGGRDKIKPDFHSEFRSYSRNAASPETSKRSKTTQ